LSLAVTHDVVPFRKPRNRKDTTAYVGMVIFLGGWAMMFGALFFAYAIVRYKQMSWPPEGESALPLLLPGINTAVLFASSVTLVMALRAVRSAQPVALRWWLVASLVLGLAFVALQYAVWQGLYASGLKPSSSIYGSVFYGLTCFHGLHVAVGLIGLISLLPRAFKGRFTVQNHTAVRMWGMYWHFVDVVWLLMFITIYVF
jgi:cytochrome c oxidase subunit III